MKTTCKIAKTELRNLFYSPVAWFLGIAFLVQCAVFFTYGLWGCTKIQDLYLKNSPKFHDWGDIPLTTMLFLGPDGIFMNALQNLFLFVPLLTMGVISREVNNGTIKLLYSSPVKIREIIFGKYLALMAYNAILVLILAIFMVIGVFTIRSVDYGMLLSSALGFYLMVCAYTAIGMFMSSLTTYQIVSAIATFVTIFALGRIGNLWQQYDFIRDLTYFLSLAGRTGKMLKGLITTKDVIYFIVVVYMFLGFTYLKLSGGRESSPWYKKASRYAIVVISSLLIGYVSSRPRWVGYWDTTARKLNTIHPRTQKILKELGDETLEVTLYGNILGGGAFQGLPEGRNAYFANFWDSYIRFKPEIDFKFVNYYDYEPATNDSLWFKTFPNKTTKEIAALMADQFGMKLSSFKTPEEIHKKIDLQPESYRLVMQLKYKGQTTFLRTFDDDLFWPAEPQISAALRRLIDGTLPKARFVTGDLERSIYKNGEREYRFHSSVKGNRGALINLGFDVDTISLENEEIPSDLKILTLADPKTKLSDVALYKIRQYVNKGGNMLILGEPGKQQMLNPLLQDLGVQLMDGTLVEPTNDEMPHMVMPYLTEAGFALAEEDFFLKKKITSDSIKILTPGATGIAYATNSPFKAIPFLMALENRTWQKTGPLVTDSVPPVYSPEEGDHKGAFPLVLGLTREINNRQQRIVVCGDADFISNHRLFDGSVARALYFWMDDGKFPIYSPRPLPKDNMLTITLETAEVVKIAFVWVLPGLLLLAAILLLIRRKRK